MGESAANPIWHISFSKKLIGKRSAGKPHAAFDVAGVGNISVDTGNAPALDPTDEGEQETGRLSVTAPALYSTV